MTRLLAALLLLAGPAQAADAWEGTYDCSQGRTGLTLTIEPDGPGVSALFHFYADPSRPEVPEGCFAMSGQVDRRSGRVDLAAGRWLLQPFFYVTVDLSGTISPDGAQLAGRVSGPGCSAFVLRRVAVPARAAPAACTLRPIVVSQAP